ncbi:glycosyltransferase family 2 protein [Wenzhouxiangella sediminis]|uniref:Glycosyltransferase family 2 protein n=1 Tax=Wenzhouxiangella sediminis TaxID=1792836 RepID=A0A3E1K4F8_9GAMM|nr:glycosyltransferase family 2 protein [Wenzhouxiangella sediminis]RFF28901.1 glycosyltransferase family 2 protein [Wenzhouxiangella sediminis]
MENPRLSIIIPAKNEAAAISEVVRDIMSRYPHAEVIVVNDGSTDDTAKLAQEAGATVINHPHALGNGAAVKRGAREASGDTLVFLDGDGQHNPADIPRLLERLDQGFDMVVGARAGASSHANTGRLMANGVYNLVASMVTGQAIPDLTSGFRAAKAQKFRQYLYLLPNGFSYPTTITMAFMRSGYPVDFIDIKAAKRKGKSHIRPVRDGIRFLMIIFKIATLYAPLKLFLPASALFFLTGVGYYFFTYVTQGRFTNMSLLLFSAAVIVFLIGLISEQITSLNYKDAENLAGPRQGTSSAPPQIKATD